MEGKSRVNCPGGGFYVRQLSGVQLSRWDLFRGNCLGESLRSNCPGEIPWKVIIWGAVVHAGIIQG